MPSTAWKKDVCRSEEHTSELQSLTNLVCRLLLEKKTLHNPRKPANSCARWADRATRRATPRHAAAGESRPGGARRKAELVQDAMFFFFLNDPGPPEFSPLPPPAPLPIGPAPGGGPPPGGGPAPASRSPGATL